MKLLQKILFVAIIGVITGNIDLKGMHPPAPPIAAPIVGANVLDFNTIFNIGSLIPTSFKPKIYQPAGYNAVGPNNLRYVYFAIPQNGIIANVNFLRAVNHAVPAGADYNIYFPADGSQPTVMS